jgi:hypothetical protein
VERPEVSRPRAEDLREMAQITGAKHFDEFAKEAVGRRGNRRKREKKRVNRSGVRFFVGNGLINYIGKCRGMDVLRVDKLGQCLIEHVEETDLRRLGLRFRLFRGFRGSIPSHRN